jgi:hypothetical protein
MDAFWIDLCPAGMWLDYNPPGAMHGAFHTHIQYLPIFTPTLGGRNSDYKVLRLKSRAGWESAHLPRA